MAILNFLASQSLKNVNAFYGVCCCSNINIQRINITFIVTQKPMKISNYLAN